VCSDFLLLLFATVSSFLLSFTLLFSTTLHSHFCFLSLSSYFLHLFFSSHYSILFLTTPLPLSHLYTSLSLSPLLSPLLPSLFFTTPFHSPCHHPFLFLTPVSITHTQWVYQVAELAPKILP
jgi:hypothetical protein